MDMFECKLKGGTPPVCKSLGTGPSLITTSKEKYGCGVLETNDGGRVMLSVEMGWGKSSGESRQGSRKVVNLGGPPEVLDITSNDVEVWKRNGWKSSKNIQVQMFLRDPRDCRSIFHDR